MEAGTPKLKRFPFDSLVLAAVAWDLKGFLGAKVQKVVQSDEQTVHLELYGHGHKTWLTLSSDPIHYRIHLGSAPENRLSPLPAFGLSIRRALEGAHLAAVEQRGFDRVLQLRFDGPLGEHLMVAELLGKHANLVFLESDGRIVGATRWMGPNKSSRPVMPGRKYEPPGPSHRSPLWMARTEEELRQSEGASPFLVALLLLAGSMESDRSKPLPPAVVERLEGLRDRVERGDFDPVYVPGRGAYPIELPEPGATAERVSTISEGLERHFSSAVREWAVSHRKASLFGQLERVLFSRELALRSLEEASDAATRAAYLQLQGELILAYAHQIEPGQSTLSVVDYSGDPMSIPLDPEKSAIENAQRLFDRAKRAKARAPEVKAQRERIALEIEGLRETLAALSEATNPDELDELEQAARKVRWLHSPSVQEKTERPFEGHRIREMEAPGGYRVLYGENATSNDYLTTKVARPNDWWLHVRGAASAHVVVPTANQPDRVPRAVLEFAAKVAAAHSQAKHSSLVAVDYTLKKYVRKPKGAAPGSVLIEREKTLHVDGR